MLYLILAIATVWAIIAVALISQAMWIRMDDVWDEPEQKDRDR